MPVKQGNQRLLRRRGGGGLATALPSGQIGAMIRPEDSAGLTTLSAPFKGGFAIFSLMSRPPLLFKEGNLAWNLELALKSPELVHAFYFEVKVLIGEGHFDH